LSASTPWRWGAPLRRFGRTHELAGPVLFLLSDMSSCMTGQILVFDGRKIVRFSYGTSADS
jgi:NAD(P)-dependent dehydrogenase (short-subunit alcohol dehydrogenase family)